MLPMQPGVPAGVLDTAVNRPTRRAQAGDAETWVLFTVDGQIYGLDLWEVERIVRAVEINPLPEVPAYVAGVVDVHGRILPVVDLRARFDRPTRPLDLADHFVIAKSPTHSVILPVDSAMGSRLIPSDLIPPATELPRCVRRVVPLDLGVVYSLDLQRVLFGDQPPFDTKLAQILAELNAI
jgi:purine-binding chemotaxis protein CheW